MLGSFNGDGIEDFVSAGRKADANSAIYLVFGAENIDAQVEAAGFGLGRARFSGLPGGLKIIPEQPGFSFVLTVSGAGDLNGDGFADLVIGNPYASTDGLDRNGRAYIVFGEAQTSGLRKFEDLDMIAGNGGFRILSNPVYSFVNKITALGDFNQDGIDDLLVGDEPMPRRGLRENIVTGRNFGAAHIIYGASNVGSNGDVLVELLDGDNGFTIFGDIREGWLGSSVASADVNNDGIQDALLGSRGAYDSETGVRGGGVYVVFGGQDFSALKPQLELVTTIGDETASHPGPEILTGSDFEWDYRIENGGTFVTDITVSRTQLLPEALPTEEVCRNSGLDAGESFECVRTDVAKAGTHKERLKISGTAGFLTVDNYKIVFYRGIDGLVEPPTPPTTSDPAMQLQVTANGQNAMKPGPSLELGYNLDWLYTVNNTGDLALNNVVIRGRQKLPSLGSWSQICSIGTVPVGGSGSCTSREMPIEGNYKSLLVARAEVPGSAAGIEALYDAFYVGTDSDVPPAQPAPASIALTSNIDGLDLAKPGPLLPDGLPATVNFLIRNTGQSELNEVQLRFRQKLPELEAWLTVCAVPALAAGAQASCVLPVGEIESGIVYKALSTVTGKAQDGSAVSASVIGFARGAD